MDLNKPMIRIHNLKSNEIIDREMNADELAQYETDIANVQAQLQAQIDAQAKKAAAEAKLTALGLTADDLKALGL